MPGRIRAEDLPRSLRATVVDRATRPAPPRTRSTSQKTTQHAQRCHTCHELLASEAAADRHSDTPGHHIIETWIGEDW